MEKYTRCLLCLVAMVTALPALPANLQQALEAWRENRVVAAQEQFQALVDAPGTAPADLAAAHRELGRSAWLVRGDSGPMAVALAHPGPAAERCATAVLALRVFREAGEPARPLAAIATQRAACKADEIDALRVQLALNQLALAQRAPGTRRSGHLQQAAAELAAVAPAAAGAAEVAATRLQLAVERQDGTAALQAWKDYFWLDGRHDMPPALHAQAGQAAALFASGLQPDASTGAVLALAELLIRAGFAEAAGQLARHGQLERRAADDPRWRRIAAYLAFRRSVQDATLRANRELASGGPAANYETEILTAMGGLMQAAGLEGDPMAALAQAYGLYGTAGKTSGYPSLHAGHLVQDDRYPVTQYGRSGSLRFIVIDNLLANGYESWLWDGWAQAGGWAPDEGTMVQVRSAYTSGPLRALRAARPGPGRDRFLAAIERNRAAERKSLGRDGLATLVGSSRVDLQACKLEYSIVSPK